MKAIISLKDATVDINKVVAIVKTDIPEDRQSPEIYLLQIVLDNLQQPINLSYETVEERDSTYNTLVDAWADVIKDQVIVTS